MGKIKFHALIFCWEKENPNTQDEVKHSQIYLDGVCYCDLKGFISLAFDSKQYFLTVW